MDSVSRRGFLTGSCALLLMSGIQALPATASTAVKRLPNGRLSVDLRKIDGLSKVGGSVRVGNIKGKPVAISRTGNTTYIAFYLSCPHQGVTVSRTEAGWKCEAHGSEFQANGDLVLGPATSGLQRLPLRTNKGIAIVG